MAPQHPVRVSPHVETYAQYPFTGTAGEGMRITADDGRTYWDFYGGHAVSLLGQGHPVIAARVQEQMRNLTFYSNALRIDVRDEAARRLVAFAPDGLESLFFCNSGAEANENALKLAVQQTGRTQLAALGGAFHGRTLLALAATDGRKLRGPYEPLLAPCRRLHPNEPGELDQIDEDVAAFIVEPIQSLAGVVELSSDYLHAARERCSRTGTLLIFDEVQTGFGRLGIPFCSGGSNPVPDMATLAKSMANGIPMGAVLMSEAIAREVRSGDLGSTFGGGPVACAALCAVLDVIMAENLVERAAEYGEKLGAAMMRSGAVGMRGRGCLLGVELDRPAGQVQAALLERGFITGTSGESHVLRLMPPINGPFEAIDELERAMKQVLAVSTGQQ